MAQRRVVVWEDEQGRKETRCMYWGGLYTGQEANLLRKNMWKENFITAVSITDIIRAVSITGSIMAVSITGSIIASSITFSFIEVNITEVLQQSV